MRALVVASALAGSVALAQFSVPNGRPSEPSAITPTSAPNVVQATTAAVVLYADPTGSDGNACTSPGASACKTIQGAINKAPKGLRHGATITLANGNYACAYITGFFADNGSQQANGGFTITGTLINATVASGAAMGTITSSSTGSSATFTTITDSGQSWTSNDLRGKLFVRTDTSAVVGVVTSNTATQVTVSSISAAPANATAYAIQVPGANINTNCPRPPSGLTVSSSSASNSAGLMAHDNMLEWNSSAILIQNLGFTNATGAAIRIGDSSSYAFNNVFINGTSTGIAQVSSQVGGAPRLFVQNVSYTGSTAGYLLQTTGTAASNVTSSLSYGSNAGLIFSSDGFPSISVSSSINATSAGLQINGTTAAGSSAASNSRFDCASSAGRGIVVGGSGITTTLATMPGMAQVALSAVDLGSTCGVLAQVTGIGSALVMTTVTGTGATTGVLANFGGAAYLVSGDTFTGATQDISLDNGNVTAALGDVASSSCLGTATYGSKVCK